MVPCLLEGLIVVAGRQFSWGIGKSAISRAATTTWSSGRSPSPAPRQPVARFCDQLEAIAGEFDADHPLQQ